MANIPSIYINLEDDVSKIVTRLNRERSSQVVLVCPKRCFLFNDSINLRLLKKQADLMGKRIFILTMDERGQQYAQEAGFELKFLPKTRPSNAMSDIRVAKPAAVPESSVVETPESVSQPSPLERLVHKVAEMVPQVPMAMPPKIVHHTQQPVAEKEDLQQAAAEDAPEQDRIFDQDEAALHPKKHRSFYRLAFGFVCISLIVILAVVFVILPKAEVIVYAKTDPVARDYKISMSPTVPAIDVEKLIIPSQQVSTILDAEQQFQSQGKKPVGSKSEGSVVLYNMTKQPINLKSSTTQLIVGNKTYTLVPDLITVKPTRLKPGTKEIDPASLGEPVMVRASVGGEEYNLPAETRMEITNQVFGSKPQFLFAKTSTAITGGNSRFLSYVTDQDINNSFAVLNNSLVAKYKDSLSIDQLVLPDKGYTVEILESGSDKAVGTETPVFTSRVKTKITAVVFKEADLRQLIQKRITQSLSGNKTLQVNNENLQVKAEQVEINNQTGVLSVHFEGKAVSNLNLEGVNEELVGKGKKEVSQILRSKGDVEKIDMVLAPVWQTNFPLFKGKIKIIVSK